jgi:MFS family permease
MRLFGYVRERDWPALFGYFFFVAMMTGGYFYNLTFVQLGLHDLGVRVIGMSESAVATNMAYLALITCITALAFGASMQRLGWGRRFVLKLRVAFAAVLVQALLTAVALQIDSERAFFAWVVLAAVALGIAVPVTFGLAVDLVPVRDRGYVAAVITSAAYFPAAVLSSDWRVETITAQVLLPTLVGAVILGVLAFKRVGFIEKLSRQHARPEFGTGRFVRRATSARSCIRRRLVAMIVLMFGVYFVDSLGFLRLIFTPAYMETAWRSPELSPHLVIGGAHVLGAVIAGALYSGLSERALFPWMFGIFAIVHLMYLMDTRLPGEGAPLAMPVLYAIAVSLYTVVNFALWADLSTPKTVGMNVALGVALSAWTATFVSTALALRWRLGGMELGTHFAIVASLASVFFIVALALAFFQTGEDSPTGSASNSDPEGDHEPMAPNTDKDYR